MERSRSRPPAAQSWIVTTATTNAGINTNGKTVSFNITRGGAVSDLKVTAPVWNSGSLAESGDGILELDAINTYTGGTTISGGTLLIGGGGQLHSGAYAGTISLFEQRRGGLRLRRLADLFGRDQRRGGLDPGRAPARLPSPARTATAAERKLTAAG